MQSVLTGGPGAGKTTVLEALQQRGYATVPEVARAVIAERKARGLSPRPEPQIFAESILKRDLRNYSAAREWNAEVVFFDRSLLDALGSLAELGVLRDTRRARLLQDYPYHDPVFLFPPWPEIYRTDSERDQSFAEAVAVFHSVKRWYTECGYGVAEVPPGTVDERCDYLLRCLDDPGATRGERLP